MLLPKFTTVPDVKVPDVSNKSVLEAEKLLKEAGFEVSITIEEEFNDVIESGNIVRTSPSANRSIKKGSTITLYQSKFI